MFKLVILVTPYWALGSKLVYDHEAAMRHAHLRVRYVSDFFPYITGTDKSTIPNAKNC